MNNLEKDIKTVNSFKKINLGLYTKLKTSKQTHIKLKRF